MKWLIAILLVVTVLFALAPQNAKSQTDDAVKSPEYNIEGVFKCDWNGKYYVRQIGNEILWFGEDDNVNPTWSNVAHGSINGDMIDVIWGDVPKGSIMQSGKLVLKIISPDRFEKVSMEGDPFGSSIWERVTE